MSLLSRYAINTWEPYIDAEQQQNLLNDLERGQVVYLPELPFALSPEQHKFLDPAYLAKNRKNVSYDANQQRLSGYNEQAEDIAGLQAFMAQFARQSQHLIAALFPHYQTSLRSGRTSFRPAEIDGRSSSYRKDDKRLHIDAFPATPVHGERILRVFSNINLQQVARRWHIGESFNSVMQRFVPKIKQPWPGKHQLLHRLKITKSKRSLYDHYMLAMHNKMKADNAYQQQAMQEAFAFPAQTTWIVFTDLVSHAALSGQHLLEQTFYLPAEAQYHPQWSPLNRLQQFLHNCDIT